MTKEIEVESFQHENLEEGEMGQLHAMHLNENAIAAIRAAMPTGPSLSECVDCADTMPVERMQAAPGCTRCIYCQGLAERR